MSDLNQFSIDQFVTGIRDRNPVVVARAITLLESAVHEHRIKAEQILEKCLPYAGQSLRIGITGAPGVGKSTFIEALGNRYLRLQKKIAILAVDPSSRKNKGSILGDKTRMEQLSKSNHVYIRPSPAGQTLGGVASATRESIILLEAAGYELILVETVGVGQSETAVFDMTDLFLLLLMAGAGDELQGIKRGIMEMADIVVINKSDGDNIHRATVTQSDFKRALHLFERKQSGWQTKVETCSSITGIGLDSIINHIHDFQEKMLSNGKLLEKRKEQMQHWFLEDIKEGLLQQLLSGDNLPSLMLQYKIAIGEERILPSAAARALIATLLSERK